MAEDDFVTIRHVPDFVEAEMLLDLLKQEGIPAMAPGTNHNALYGGVMRGALNVPLKVPASQVERARAILDALEEHEVDPEDAPPRAVAMSDVDGPYRGGMEQAGPAPRKKGVAIAAAIILPMVLALFGSGHFYARSFLRGFALLAGAWTLIVLGLGGRPSFLLGLPLIVLADALGACAVIGTRAAPNQRR